MLAGGYAHHAPMADGWRSTTGDLIENARLSDGMAEDGDDPLITMISEIVRDFDADGVVITHDSDHDGHVTLFADGVWRSTRLHLGDSLIESPADDIAGEWRRVPDQPQARVLTTRTPTSTGLITVRTLFRSVSDRTIGRARAASARLQPLLNPLVRLWWQRRRIRSSVRTLTAAIDKADDGVILIDGKGRPMFANVAARQLLEQHDGLRLIGDALSGNSRADTLRLRVAFEHAIAGGDEWGTVPVVAMPRHERRPLMVAIMPANDEVDPTDDQAVVLYIFDPEQDLCSLIEPACRVYQLSPVETRLTCLLADGMSLAEAAEKMRVRDMTARSYLKQIFLKTQTNRQAELVWLMLKSAVRARSGALSGQSPYLRGAIGRVSGANESHCQQMNGVVPLQA